SSLATVHAHRDLHSFPTRRSSDLRLTPLLALRGVAPRVAALLLLRRLGLLLLRLRVLHRVDAGGAENLIESSRVVDGLDHRVEVSAKSRSGDRLDVSLELCRGIGPDGEKVLPVMLEGVADVLFACRQKCCSLCVVFLIYKRSSCDWLESWGRLILATSMRKRFLSGFYSREEGDFLRVPFHSTELGDTAG